jgi:hypothetical protein
MHPAVGRDPYVLSPLILAITLVIMPSCSLGVLDGSGGSGWKRSHDQNSKVWCCYCQINFGLYWLILALMRKMSNRKRKSLSWLFAMSTLRLFLSWAGA